MRFNLFANGYSVGVTVGVSVVIVSSSSFASVEFPHVWEISAAAGPSLAVGA
jgi:hypothetical protein